MTDDSLLEPDEPQRRKVEEIDELERDPEDDAPGVEGLEHFGLTAPD
jgi:hypothetical protein